MRFRPTILTLLLAASPAAVRAVYAAGSSQVFLETMASQPAKPWTGAGCSNPWTVSFKGNSPFEQGTNWNYGTGNSCGMQFKQGTSSLADNRITTSQAISTAGDAAYAEFYLSADGLTANAGWTFQVDAGAGYVTRLSELSGTNHAWQLYHYDLLSAERVNTLHLRFQFAGGAASNRINLDQISVTVVAGSNTGTDTDTNTPSASVGQLASIPGGSYVMGDHFGFVDEEHPTDELPLHSVAISPFLMATTLVTCREYCAYLNAAMSLGLIGVRQGSVYGSGGGNLYIDTVTANAYSTILWSGSTFTVRSGRDLHPGTGVRWYGAIGYCNWLSGRDGYEPCYDIATGDCDMTKNGYRLPTEAEWEYAARGGLTDPYCVFPWGNDTNADGALANWEGSGDPWEEGDYPHTTPVGFYNGSLRIKADYGWPAAVDTYQTRDGSNGFGLFDMAGNVWEWVNDWYQSQYYAYCVANGVVNDPPGPSSGDVFTDHGGLAYRGMRGGTWYNGGGQVNLGYSRVSNRDPSWSLGPSPDRNPDTPWFQVGFRIMRRPTTASTTTTQTVGLFLNTAGACPGYTLMSPMHSTQTYLLNNAGRYVHKWTGTGEPGRSSYLLENGHLIRASAVMKGGPSTGGGEGGRIEEYDWANNLVWAFDYYGPDYIAHHDFKVLPNGNVLVLVAEKKTYAEVLAAGFNPTLLDPSIASQGYMLPDSLVEVKPAIPYGGTVVWQWHIWDHLIQDYGATKNNYGVVANHPELMNVNGTGRERIQQFWNHMNGIDYNAELDQVILSIRNNSELFIIDHSTTTAQAAGHTGGRYSKGGDILYRWGNPQQYDRGTTADRTLFQQHHTHWIDANCPGSGHLLIFNNGIGRGYSTIDEIMPPVDAAGNYTLASDAAFGPSSPLWTYKADPPASFYSAEISGCQRLPNGNTLICEGVTGRLFEVTSTGETVWQYVCPVTTSPLAQGSAIPPDPGKAGQYMNAVFRVVRYAPDFAGLKDKDLTPQGPIETYPGSSVGGSL
jgi:formylglycine-generating enzyme required for sulfatase activity